MLQAVVADNQVEGGRRKRHACRVGKHVPARTRAVGLLQVQPDHQQIPPFRGETAWARAQIEHTGAGRKVSDEVEHGPLVR